MQKLNRHSPIRNLIRQFKKAEEDLIKKVLETSTSRFTLCGFDSYQGLLCQTEFAIKKIGLTVLQKSRIKSNQMVAIEEDWRKKLFLQNGQNSKDIELMFDLTLRI